MLCANCGRENVPGASFCAACGAPLSPGYAPPPEEPPAWSGRPQTSGMAVASLVFAVCSPVVLGISYVLIPSLPVALAVPGAFIVTGFVLGGAALRQVGARQRALRGRGLAIAGMVVCGVILAGLVWLSMMCLRLGPYSIGVPVNGAVIVAARSGDEASIEALLQEDPNLVNARDNLAKTPLHWAAVNGNHPKIAELLLQHGADVNACCGGGTDTSAADLFAPVPRVGANIRGQMRKGITPLMCAVLSDGSKRKEIIALLIANGADVNARNAWGATPLSLALSEREPEIAELLRQNGARE